jgi:hypothetical protein
MKKLHGFMLFPLLLWLGTAHADNEVATSADLTLTRDDNLNRNIIPDDEVKDSFATTSISLQQSQRLSTVDYVSYNAQFKYEHYNETDGLNNAEVGVGIKYNVKPVAGFTKPIYIFSTDASLIDSSTDIRDTTAVNAGLTVSSWITNKISARGGMAYRIKDSDSRVFDTRDLRFFINADLLLSTRLTTYTTVNYINGQTVSTADISNTSPEILNVINLADEIEFDPTFGPDQLAYRFDSITRMLTIGMNFAIAQQQSLDFSVRNVRSKAGGNIDYAVTQFSLSYLLSF